MPVLSAFNTSFHLNSSVVLVVVTFILLKKKLT